MSERRNAPRVFDRGHEVPPGWLTERLREKGGLALEVSVSAVECERIGTGQMGVCDRLRLSYDGDPGPGAPRSLVGKFASDNPTVRSTFGPLGYLTEIRFYRDLAPTLRARIPRAWAAEIDTESWAFTLLLDDLAPAVPGDQLAGITLDEAKVGMTELVGLHAPRWNDPALASEPCLRREGFTIESLEPTYQAVMPGFLERFGDAVGSEGREVLGLLATGTNRWLARAPAIVSVVHGDYRPDNLLFDRSGPELTIAAVDFQGVGAGVPQEDVAFFLATSLPIAERREHETSLVRRWYDGLCAAGVSDYPWARCQEDYRWATIAGFKTTILGAAFSDPTERGERMFVRMITGQIRQALDLGAVELLR